MPNQIEYVRLIFDHGYHGYLVWPEGRDAKHRRLVDPVFLKSSVISRTQYLTANPVVQTVDWTRLLRNVTTLRAHLDGTGRGYNRAVIDRTVRLIETRVAQGRRVRERLRRIDPVAGPA